MQHSQNSFTRSDLAEAEEAFALWQGQIHESVDEYTLRKRKKELYALVRKVIKNELTADQQKFVQLRWYEGKTLTEIAAVLGIDKSSVSRKEKKINDIIYDKLKYAMEYRFGRSFSNDSRLIIKSNTKACLPCENESIAQRLIGLRSSQSLDINTFTQVTGIKKSRVELFEKDGAELTAGELSQLCRLYGTTSDYILFGRKREDMI